MTMRRTSPLLVAAAVLAGGLALSPTTAGGQTACEQPYAPVAARGSNVVDGSWGEPIPALDAAEVSSRLQITYAFDSDGDGVDDTVAAEPGGGLRITRGDGDLVLTSDGPAQAYRVGDIDGDGRDELAVVHGGSQSGTYLIPGTTAPGTTTPTAAGIAVPGARLLSSLDDGTGRMLAHIGALGGTTDSRTDVLDSAAVLALGPGGDAGSIAPEVSVAGTTEVVADLGGPGLVILVGRTLAGPDRVEVSVVDGTTVNALTTVPERFEGHYVSPYGALSVLDGPDGTFVRLDQSSRAGGAAYLWSLDDPCTSLVDDDDTTTSSSTTPVTPAATPATPVDAAATFTG